ncbi:hypothetical protein ACFC09_38320 [Streptomyces sp. NPDC056161]|uniref:hypothetical protein n=1 Tax=Streptomyces sp. NPDC056161 TaxID=3345732 RepID=UPI0035D7F525
MGLVVRALERLGAPGAVEPGTVAERLFDGGYRGIAKTLSFTTGNTLDPSARSLYFLFQADGNNTFRFLGRSGQVK